MNVMLALLAKRRFYDVSEGVDSKLFCSLHSMNGQGYPRVLNTWVGEQQKLMVGLEIEGMKLLLHIHKRLKR